MKPKPNILWIFFEDTFPFYGCYGDSVARTPNLDKLASEGRLYENAFSTAGVCAPARSGIITGMYPTSIGTHHMRTTHTHPDAPELPTPYAAVIPHYAKCFPEYLRAAGYYCTNNDKTDYQFDPPFTCWDELSKKAHWRNRPSQDRPFFAVWNLQPSHESGMWPENCPEPAFDPKDMKIPPYFPDTAKVREALCRMYTHIENNDRILGQMLKELEDEGLSEDTLVLHSSDHGPLPRGKRWPYDQGIHMPLIIRWPGKIKPGERTDRLVSTLDLGPSMLSAAGVEIPLHMHGQAFLGGQEKPERKFVFASRDRHDEAYDMMRAARDKRYKYIRNFRPDLPYYLWIPYLNRHPAMQELAGLYAQGKLEAEQELLFRHPRPVEELYDTKEDPWETNNLAQEPAMAKEKESLSEALDAWRAGVGDLGEIPEAEMVRRWYPNGERPATAPVNFIPLSSTHFGMEAANTGGKFKGPLRIQMQCVTQGASIGYRFEDDPENSWRLYTGPIALSPGSHSITAKAIRIGYLEGPPRTVRFTVN